MIKKNWKLTFKIFLPIFLIFLSSLIVSLIYILNSQYAVFIETNFSLLDLLFSRPGILGILGFLLVLVLNFMTLHYSLRIFVLRPFEQSKGFLELGVKNFEGIAKEIRGTSKMLTDNANSEASSVHQLVSSSTEVSSMVRQTLEFANQTREATLEVRKQTNEGAETIKGLSHSMEEIESANAELFKMKGIIDQVAQKTSAINEIVTKTQLLSFNASIEAARAGQYGKGFSVVAEEVGNLAQTSGKAANEIKALLTDSQANMQNILESTQSKINHGAKVTKRAIKIFSQIQGKIEDVSLQIQRIDIAANEQSKGIEESNKGIELINEKANTVLSISRTILELSNRIDDWVTDVKESFQGINVGDKKLVIEAQKNSKKGQFSGTKNEKKRIHGSKINTGIQNVTYAEKKNVELVAGLVEKSKRVLLEEDDLIALDPDDPDFE